MNNIIKLKHEKATRLKLNEDIMFNLKILAQKVFRTVKDELNIAIPIQLLFNEKDYDMCKNLSCIFVNTMVIDINNIIDHAHNIHSEYEKMILIKSIIINEIISGLYFLNYKYDRQKNNADIKNIAYNLALKYMDDNTNLLTTLMDSDRLYIKKPMTKLDIDTIIYEEETIENFYIRKVTDLLFTDDDAITAMKESFNIIIKSNIEPNTFEYLKLHGEFNTNSQILNNIIRKLLFGENRVLISMNDYVLVDREDCYVFSMDFYK